MLLERRAQMFKHDPFIEGNKVYFYKEGLGLNPNYYLRQSGTITDTAQRMYLNDLGYVYFGIPSSMRLTRVYMDGYCVNPASNQLVRVRNTDGGSGADIILNYFGSTWGGERITRSSTSNIKRGVNWELSLYILHAKLYVYNLYAEFTSL